MKYCFLLLLLLTLRAAPAAGPAGGGIDKSSMDTSCKPCDDFYRYANGGWLDRNPIPARYSDWGTFRVLSEANRERLRVILDSAAANTAAVQGSPERLIGDLYGSCTDTAAIDALATKPLQPELDKVAAISSVAALKAHLVDQQRIGFAGPFIFGATPDLKNSEEMIGGISAGGLSLPERDYYFRDDDRTKTIRSEFLAHVTRMMQLIGESPEAAATHATAVLAFETALAESTMTNVERRDPYKRYNRMDLQGVARLAPELDWKRLLANFDLPETTPLNVSEPKFLETVNRNLTATPLDDWKTWLRWRVASAAAPLLSKPFFDESFRFRSTVLTGAKEQLPRWQTCTATVDGMLGDALGQLFVAKHFPPEAKQRMSGLVENLRATLKEELKQASWLQQETRDNAVAKLEAFVAKIGYADKWRDYRGVTFSRETYFRNMRAIGLHNRLYQVAKIGKPIDRTEWSMTPPTVNAYYSPPRNEIAFPAGILQPPFFDMDADDAVNYGAIGAVIGHEMGHGFDDQGSKFDAKGNLRNWWTAEDRKKFDERAACVIDQYNALAVGDGLRHNGQLVVGEALGDLGGVTIAYKAYKRSLHGMEGPAVEGFTADQRFFLAFARVWTRIHTPEDLRLRLNTDPHPIARFRAIGTLQNVPQFHEAFGCKTGDPMVRPPEKQCKLW